MLPVEILREAVGSYAPYLQASGEMHDPVFGEPTQYGTPYHAFCNAVLAREDGGERRPAYADRAVRGLEAALDHVLDPGLPPTASGFDGATGAVDRSNHRDYFWPPILKTFLILRELGLRLRGACRPQREPVYRRVGPLPQQGGRRVGPDTNDYRSQWLGVPQDEDPDNAFKIQWEMFLRHVAADEPFPYDLLEGAKGVQLAELGLRSWRERRWLEVPALERSPMSQEELGHA